jgi:hypothetical protein
MDTEWLLSLGEGEEISHLDWRYIQEALHRMDGATLNMISLRRTGQKDSLMAGGGNTGRYIVAYFPDDNGAVSYILTDISLAGPDITLIVQTPAQYPARWCIELPLVLKAFENFFRTGEVPKEMRWELDDYSGVEVKW